MSEVESVNEATAPEVESDDVVATSGTDEATAPEQLPADHPLVKALASQKALVKELKLKAAKLDEIENAQKTELQKALERAEAAEKRANTAEFESLRSRVASAKGVPASALTGATEEELSASADELLAWRGKAEVPPAPKPGPGGLRSGVTGSGPSSADPKERAALAIRELFDK